MELCLAGRASVVSFASSPSVLRFRRTPPLARLSGAQPFPLSKTASTVQPKQQGIYAVYEKGSLQYIGVSRDVSGSLLSHIAAVCPGSDGGEESFEARVKLLPGLSGKDLQAEWLEWIKEHGVVPPGNEKGNTRWTSKAAAAPARKAAAAPPLLDVAERRNAEADAIVTAEVWSALCRDGFVVIDNVLPEEAALAAREGAEQLRRSGLMRSIASQSLRGRTDEILVLGQPPIRVPEGAATAEGIAALERVAGLLHGLPHAIDRHRTAAASGAPAWPPALAPVSHLQLACYPGEGTRYPRHLDNDPRAAGARDGPPGLRVSDRSVTALMYLNESVWDEASGGHLRVYGIADSSGSGAGSPSSSEEGKGKGEGFRDFAPVAGRLILFRSDAIDHEVLPAFKQRWALSAWIPRKDAFMSV